MSDFVTIPATWVKVGAGAIAVAFIALFMLGRCSAAPDPAPLPPKAQRRLDLHRIATAVDTAEVNRLARDQAAAKARQRAAAVVRQELEDAARVEHRRADSLAAIASAVTKSADSSSWAWMAAYQARTFEVVTLQRALDSAKAETGHSDTAGATGDTIAAVDLRRAVRADSVITTVVDVATHPNQCRVFFDIIKCPTRKQAFVGGVLAGAALAAIATGKIKIPIALRF